MHFEDSSPTEWGGGASNLCVGPTVGYGGQGHKNFYVASKVRLTLTSK